MTSWDCGDHMTCTREATVAVNDTGVCNCDVGHIPRGDGHCGEFIVPTTAAFHPVAAVLPL